MSVTQGFFAVVFFCVSVAASASPSTVPHPILFVTQVPTGYDFVTMNVSSPFANHLPTTLAAPRGGDLVLLSTSGALRFLTQEAGYGSAGGATVMTGNQAIAVRDPAIAFDASKAIFSMVVGAPATVGGAENYSWQLYEITNLQQVIAGQTPIVQKVANQPALPFNNIQPIYLSDGSIVFASDRPRNGALVSFPAPVEVVPVGFGGSFGNQFQHRLKKILQIRMNWKIHMKGWLLQLQRVHVHHHFVSVPGKGGPVVADLPDIQAAP